MSHYAIFLLALALSADACVVAFSYALKNHNRWLKTALQLALTTGIFQALMPVLGYFLTEHVKTYVQPYAKFIAFFIFVYLGIKFIREAFSKNEKTIQNINMKILIFIGIATSIDAFSAGITLSLFGNKILKPAFFIGLVTFINAFIGFIIGKNFKHLPSQKLEIFAGVLLILLGIKSLLPF